MKICPVCRTPVPHDAPLCAQCGAVFPQPHNAAPPITAGATVQRPQNTTAPPAPGGGANALFGAEEGNGVSAAPFSQAPGGPAAARPGALRDTPAPYPGDWREAAPGAVENAPEAHSVAHAVLLSVLATGFGQVYNKQAGKGVLIMALGVSLFLGCVGMAFSDWVRAAVVFVIGALVIVAVATLDAALIARRLQRGETVGKWQCF